MSSKPDGGLETAPHLPARVASDTKVAMLEDYEQSGRFHIVTTVRHTGTHSIKAEFPNYFHWHCNPEALELIEATDGYADVITTLRDPLRVAASWYNRAQLPVATTDYRSPHNAGCVFSWKEAWYYYGQILKFVPPENVYPIERLKFRLYTHSDDQGMHEFLDNGDMESFYKIADKSLIDYAYEQIC